MTTADDTGTTPLARYTTLGLGGPARDFLAAATEADLLAAVTDADAAGTPLLILGGGSNLVVSDDGFPGTVVQVGIRGISYQQSPDGVDVTVAAGEEWDDVVAATVGEGLAGLECLSGIPGRAGATPIQNVGAYGQEVADVIAKVRVFDRVRHEITQLPNAGCGFGYRTSVFKRGGSPGPGRYVVLAATFRLAEQKLSCPVRYPQLAAELRVDPGDQVAAEQVRSAVLRIRARKGMVIDPADPDTRSAGSFFMNPVLDLAQVAQVEAAAAARGLTSVPRFAAGDGMAKVPAAWLIEHAGFRPGYAIASGGARISAKHTLALVNPGGATTAGLLDLARAIRNGVHDAFGVTLEPEPVFIGATL